MTKTQKPASEPQTQTQLESCGALKEAERRSHLRVDLKTLVTIVAQEKPELEFQVVKGWSQDVSLGGARVFTKEPVMGTKVYMKFLMPGQAQQFVEAEIVRSGKWNQTDMLKRVVATFNDYRVRFIRVVTDPQILDCIQLRV